MKQKKIIVLGCTGSIGQSTTTICRHHPDLFTITALAAHTNEEELLNLAEEFNVSALCLSGRHPDSDKIHFSSRADLLKMIEETEADIVINGIPGAAGLLPSVTTINSGKTLALANKETVVMAGKLIKELAAEKNSLIIPLDSEHSAIFNLLQKISTDSVEEVILTASGGAFRDTPLSELKYVTVKDALLHPTWSMGKKITIDSATMANKGLEVLEAHHLFDFALDKIHILVHPQSYVHSLIRTTDSSLYAQISKPNMTIPIQNALTYPEITTCMYGRLNLVDCTFTFRAIDSEKYPIVETAYKAASLDRAYPTAFNAANEIAVDAFMHGKIEFLDIPVVVQETLEADWGMMLVSFEHVLSLDKEARDLAIQIVKRYSK